MKPIAIFRHSNGEGPGYFATFLDRHSIPWQLFKLDEGEAPPSSPNAFSGLCFMGGHMSVNDDIPWIPLLLDLIRSAVAQDIPVIGHCLGGQLMSKALGGVVSLNPVKEIGWGKVRVLDDEWLPDTQDFLSFHWHGETFSIPDGARRVLESEYCGNQAFALGPHLGLQCHVEMTESMVRNWSTGGAKEIERAGDIPSVQKQEQQLDGVDAKLDDLHAIADRLYSKWITQLKH
ncbi:MAG TPA: type 1 glutamine amidotransferase [Rhodocyclaceae bacterium]|jgi:GMP synthase-like glutamine amidotransferase|nr:type 1 glutamine amidotransferase [Rhodocyclaceae bacterium]